MKKLIVRLTISTIVPILFVLLLYKLSDRLNHRDNSFIRLFPPHATRVLAKRNLHYNSFYIAGLSENKITLGNFTSIEKVVSWDYSLRDSSVKLLLFPKNEELYWSSMKITALVDTIYLIDVRTPALLKACDPNDTLRLDKLSCPQLINAVVVPPGKMIGRYYDRERDQSFLMLAGQRRDIMLDRFTDGLFAADGLLVYNQEKSQLFYIYAYKNKFISLDTNLQVNYQANTIDTNTVPKIKVASIHNEASMAAPPVMINKKACTDGKYLFIHSGLRANNEDRPSFDKNNVIDVYNVDDGRYFRSFYLRPESEKKLTYFEVYKDRVVALYEDELIVYSLII